MSLKGYRTYIVFVVYALTAILANYGLKPTDDHQGAIDAILRILNDPAVVALIGTVLAFIMRRLTTTPAGKQE